MHRGGMGLEGRKRFNRRRHLAILSEKEEGSPGIPHSLHGLFSTFWFLLSLQSHFSSSSSLFLFVSSPFFLHITAPPSVVTPLWPLATESNFFSFLFLYFVWLFECFSFDAFLFFFSFANSGETAVSLSMSPPPFAAILW